MKNVNNTVLTLETFLPYRLSVLANRVSTALADIYQQKFDISRPQWRVIAVLGEHMELSAMDIADSTAMDKVAVSRAVAGLVDKKLIRQKTDRRDKRRSLLSLSAAGKRTYDAIVPVAQAFEEQLLAQLTKQEQATLMSVLSKLDGLTDL